MTERLLRVRVRMVTGEFNRGIREVTGSVRGAERQQIASQTRTTREAQRGARARTQAEARAAREQTREANTLARTKARLEAQTTREAQRGARERASADARASREQAREANALFRIRQGLHRQEAQLAARNARAVSQRRTATGRQELAIGMGGSAAAIAQSSAMFAASLESIVTRLDTITTAVAQRAGVQDVGQRTASAQDFELAMNRGASEFFQGQSPAELAVSMAALQAEILGVAEATGQAPTELLEVLSQMQTEFSAFDAGRANLREIAMEAQRTGSDMATLGRFVGILNQQLGDTAPTAEQAFNVMAEIGLEGAITPESLAENFGGHLGAFQVASGAQGEDALRQFAAMANAIRPGAADDATAATQMGALIQTIGDPHTRDAIRATLGGRQVGRGSQRHWEGGSTAFRSDGTVDFQQLISDVSMAQDSERGLGVSQAFHNRTARQAMVTLTRAQRGDSDSPSMAALASADASAAATRRAQDVDRVMGTSAIESRRLGVLGQIEGVREMSPRVEGANAQIAFREAVTETNAEGLVGMTATLPLVGEWLAQNVLPQLAGLASGLAPETRAMMGSVQQREMSGQGMFAGAGMIGPGADMAVAGGLSFLQQLAQLGDRQAQIVEQSRSVRIEPGAVVELGAATVDRLRSGAGPAPTATLAAAPSSRRVGTAQR